MRNFRSGSGKAGNHRGDPPPRRTRLKMIAAAVAVGVGSVCSVAAPGITSAAMTDRADLNLGNGAADSGIGFPDVFDIGVVLPNDTVEDADGPGGFDWTVPEAATLVPGHSVTTTIPVFNNTPTLGADTTFEIVLRNGDGQTAAGVPNITEFLRFTAEDDSGDLLFADVSWSDARASLGVLDPRGTAALAPGDGFTAGDAGSADAVTLIIDYPDVAGVEAYNGGQSAFSVRFDATSTAP